MGNNQTGGDRSDCTIQTGSDFQTSNQVRRKKKEVRLTEIIREMFPMPKNNRQNNRLTVTTAKNRMTITGGDPYDADIEFGYKTQVVRSSAMCTIPRSTPRSNYQPDYELNIKTADHIRRSYISKLITSNVWEPLDDSEKAHNSIIIYDWDDTLLPTTALSPSGIFIENTPISDNDFQRLVKLESSVYELLRLSIDRADTYIITNAAPGWVEYSAEMFYPKVYPLLNKITIVSARGEYECRYPGDSRQWKVMAFLNLLRYTDTNLVTNLISLGDSPNEMEAAYILASRFGKAFVKTVKFRENPRPSELNKQLTLVIKQFDSIFSSVKNLSIKVDKKSERKES
jgi:hypothetical protein